MFRVDARQSSIDQVRFRSYLTKDSYTEGTVIIYNETKHDIIFWQTTSVVCCYSFGSNKYVLEPGKKCVLTMNFMNKKCTLKAEDHCLIYQAYYQGSTSSVLWDIPVEKIPAGKQGHYKIKQVEIPGSDGENKVICKAEFYLTDKPYYWLEELSKQMYSDDTSLFL